MQRKSYPVNVDTPDGPMEIGTVEVTTYDSIGEIPSAELAKVLQDANRQRIQDAKNVFRADYKAARDGSKRALKKEREELLARLADGDTEVIGRIGELTKMIGA